MLKIHESYSLKKNNTFGADIACSWFTEPKSVNELIFALGHASERSWKVMVLGEGSNMLFVDHFHGIVIHPLFKGIDIVDESGSELLVRAGAGENWDHFAGHCVSKGWYGPENLSLIPGTVGAAPIQNIGAYGAEVKDFIEFVEVLDTAEMKPAILSNAACEFGYRDSLFKHGQPGRYIVTHVIFRLRKKSELRLDYGNVREEFARQERQDLQGLRHAIVSIRQGKLPDPGTYGNAGSFFKNPVVSRLNYTELKDKHPGIPHYPAGDNTVKIPAAWLIENAGWKGVRLGSVGTWPAQPLVIVNYGGATGKEIFEFSEKIKANIESRFGIELEREVTIIH